MEIDPELLKLAKALLLDVPCNARIVSGSVMDAEFMASLGRFDIITSNDVIEHVDNPGATPISSPVCCALVEYFTLPSQTADFSIT